MSSAKSIPFDFGDGDEFTVHLGRAVEKRNVKQTDGALYPQATVANLDAVDDPFTVGAASATDLLFVGAGNIPTSDNIGYGVVDNPLLQLPYPGIPSLYRIRIKITYEFPQVAISGDLTIDTEALNAVGGVVNRKYRKEDLAGGVGSMVINYIDTISELTRVVVSNNTDSPVDLILPGAFADTTLSVTYLGAI